jgi:hypothetical protein
VTAQQKFVPWVFRIAGIYGVIALAPQYFLEGRISRDFPPAITHPEHFYGFIGVALAWQFAFFVIAGDPPRFRSLMPVCVLEKLAFGVAAVVLFLQARVPAAVLPFGLIDLLLATLFAISFVVTPRE